MGRRREYVWTDAGLADARQHKVEPVEVEQALFAPPGLRFERHIGDLLLVVMGMADTARVIAVLCDRLTDTTYRIVSARALAGAELDEWRRRLG
ncbi:MAG TPA: hypothetical protein VF054_07005 [Micromonosporaceae bacterium]